MKSRILPLAVAVAVTLAIGWTAYRSAASDGSTDGAAPSPAKWEYKVLAPVDLLGLRAIQKEFREDNTDPEADAIKFARHAAHLESALNKLGTEGWELCCRTENAFVFKRPCDRVERLDFSASSGR